MNHLDNTDGNHGQKFQINLVPSLVGIEELNVISVKNDIV